MTDYTNQNAPASTEPLDAVFATDGPQMGAASIASIPSDRLYRLAALTAGIFLLVSLL